jgi:hypothetical protein
VPGSSDFFTTNFEEKGERDWRMAQIENAHREVFPEGFEPVLPIRRGWKEEEALGLRFWGFEVVGRLFKCLVEMKGFEPSTYALRTHRSPI